MVLLSKYERVDRQHSRLRPVLEYIFYVAIAAEPTPALQALVALLLKDKIVWGGRL